MLQLRPSPIRVAPAPDAISKQSSDQGYDRSKAFDDRKNAIEIQGESEHNEDSKNDHTGKVVLLLVYGSTF